MNQHVLFSHGSSFKGTRGKVITKQPWTQPNAKPNHIWVLRGARLNILGPSTWLSPSICGTGNFVRLQVGPQDSDELEMSFFFDT